MKELVTHRASATALEVLVIEDDVEVQEMVASALHPFGYQTRCVADGMEGIALLRAGGERYCLVLLDLGLAGMNGFEVLAQQANDPAIDGIPVVVMSGRDQIDEADRPKAWVHTLHKPMVTPELVHAVVRFARWARPAASPSAVTVAVTTDDGTVVPIEDLDTERYVAVGPMRAPMASE